MVDFVFKLLLGSPEHAAVTIHFLRAILGKYLKINRVEFQNPILGKETDEDKWIVLDILVTDDENRQYNIEMQTTIPAGQRQRLAYYLSRLYVTQMKEGEKYHQLRPTIVICVLSQPLCPEFPQLHKDFQMRDESGKPLTDALQIHLLQLTYLTVTRENLATASPIERWAFFLLNAETMSEEELRARFHEPEFVEAIGVLKVIHETPEKMHEYNARLKLKLDETARMDYAVDKALQDGLDQGILIGEDKGRKEGRQEGILVGEKKGELIGRIAILEELLGMSEPTREELSNFEIPQLTELADQLRLQLRTRGV